MDQDSFRHLLQTSNGNNSSSTLGISSSSRSKLSVPSKQTALGESSKPAFKPRNIKKLQESSHGGHTTEHGFKARTGRGHTNNEEVEKVQIGEHSQPVKGLDFALLEQEKAKAGLLSKDDVDELEQAFAEHSSQQPERVAPKKRTREEIIRELKQKRAQEAGQAPRLVEEEVKLLEDAKQKGKFKPIGFKPVNSSSGKKRKGDGDSEKMKKRKVEERKQGPKKKPSTPSTTGVKTALPLQNPEVFAEPSKGIKDIDEDFDIFAGAGEYTGVEIDDDDEEINESRSQKSVGHDGDQRATSILPQRHWIAMDDELGEIPPTRQIMPLRPPPPTDSQPGEDQETEEKPIRLAPLESSAVPSIKDLLEMDDAAGRYERKQKRKEKKSKKTGKGAASDGD